VIETYILPTAQTALTIGVGLVSWLLKRQIDQGDRKLDLMCRRLNELQAQGYATDKASAVADGVIREKLAVNYVSKADCQGCAGERRETTTLLFQKVERLQESQGRLDGKIDVLVLMAKEKAKQ
jgi:hypothetical protein